MTSHNKLDEIIAIDIHFHAVPAPLVDALRRSAFAEIVEIVKGSDLDRMVFHAPEEVVVEPSVTIKPEQYEPRLLIEALEQRKLTGAAVSLPPELFLYWASPQIGERLARAANDGFAQMAGAHPDRFFPLATLPLQDGRRASRELERAITELHLKGAAICTHVNGMDLDHPDVAPVLAKAEELDVPLFLHPQNAGDIRRIRDYHLWNVVGFPLETVIAASRLVADGAFERLPRLKIVLAHGGGFFPYQIGRLDRAYRAHPAAFKDLPKPPSAYLENVYCDSLTHNEQSLRFLINRLGAEHVVLGTDYPFTMRCDTPVDKVKDLHLAATEERAILGGTLARLLKLPRTGAGQPTTSVQSDE
jgi:aminocarboxymuconate-semialdehyde decarboxylase